MHTSPSSRKQHRNTGADKSWTEKVLIAREFLESLAKTPSHYCRKDSHKLYLETVITSGTYLSLQYLQNLPDGSVSYKINYTGQWQPLPQRQRKNKADGTITRMYKAPMRIMSTKWQHLQKLKKVLPKDYHHFYECTASCRLVTEHRNFVSSDSKASTPGHQRNMLSSLRIRTCMVLSHD